MKLKNILKSYALIIRGLYSSSKFFFFFSFSIVILLGIIPSIMPILLQYLIKSLDNISESHFWFHFSACAIFYLLAHYVTDSLRDIKSISLRLLETYLVNFMHKQFIEKIKSVKYLLFFNPKFLNLYECAKSCCESEPMRVVFTFLSTISSIIQFISAFFLLLSFNKYVPLILIPFFIPTIFLKLKLINMNAAFYKKQSILRRKVGYYFGLLTNKESLKEIRLFLANHFFKSKYLDSFKESICLLKRFLKKEIFFTVFIYLIPKIGILISIYMGALQVIKGEYDIANFMCYIQLLILIKHNCAELVGNLSQNYSSLLLFENYHEFLQFDSDYSCGNLLVSKENKYTMEIKNVSFKYDKEETFALQDINLTLSPGEVVCILGENGSGKTTLINLLLRLFTPTKGKILLNNIDITEYDMNSYLGNICCANQEFSRYSMLINEYISLSNMENYKDTNRLKLATQKATMCDLIDTLPNGYESVLTKIFDRSGVELSGGQWQKLAISRIFFSDAKILIFDEPTSAIDPFSEAEIYENIRKAGNDKTCIFISHRLYTSKLADKIILLEHGKILESGTHLELMNLRGKYYQMYISQAKNYKD
jgi:ATP-binding cassette subfamily B protein